MKSLSTSGSGSVNLSEVVFDTMEQESTDCLLSTAEERSSDTHDSSSLASEDSSKKTSENPSICASNDQLTTGISNGTPSSELPAEAENVDSTQHEIVYPNVDTKGNDETADGPMEGPLVTQANISATQSASEETVNIQYINVKPCESSSLDTIGEENNPEKIRKEEAEKEFAREANERILGLLGALFPKETKVTC